MRKQPKQKFGPNEFDTRVRERYLANGILDQASLEKHLGDLKDMAANAATFDLRQPSLAGDGDANDSED